MKVTIKRKEFTETSTTGEMFVDGVFLCYTLEDKDRGLKQTDPIEFIAITKVHSKTAIPYGTYDGKFSMSNRFERVLPEIINVPGFAGIRIHSGNTSVNTEGCILLGRTKSKDFIGESRLAMSSFFLKVAPAKKFVLQVTK